MTSLHATPPTRRSSSSRLLASVCAAVALHVALMPFGSAPANASHVGAAAGNVAASMQATLALAAGLADERAWGAVDHGDIAPDAVSAGDVETVEMSIAAYDRPAQAAPSR